METTLTKTKTRNLAKEFAQATVLQNLEKLKDLLADEGVFEVPGKEGDALDVNKEKFLSWYYAKVLTTPITKIEYDQCIFCNIGNPVVLFNQGTFPLETTRFYERNKVGLALELKETQITGIVFCNGLLITDNPKNYECPRNGERVEDYLSGLEHLFEE